MKSLCVYVGMSLGVMALWMSACGETEEKEKNYPDTETVTDAYRDTGTGTETGESGDSDTGDTEHVPPDLPELCELVTEVEAGVTVGQQELSGPGDGSLPDIQFSSDLDIALTAWAYFDFPQGVEEWVIQTAPYVGSVTDVDGAPSYGRAVGDIVAPMDRAVVAEDPSLAAGEGEFGLAWRDGRWDASCDVTTFSECSREVAFSVLNELGEPVGDPADPVRVTSTGGVAERPNITSVDGGYLITWIVIGDTAAELMGVKISNGAVGEPQRISGENGVEIIGSGAVAANGELAVIVWASAGRGEILSRVWRHDEALPSQTASVVSDAGNELLKPRIAAGADGFLTGWTARTLGDVEVYLRTLDAQGEVDGDLQQATWTKDDVLAMDVAAGPNGYAVAWASTYENGSSDCAQEACNDQIFTAPVGDDGALLAKPVMLSDDPNICRDPALAWDGVGWTAVWETRRLDRWQIMFGQSVCP